MPKATAIFILVFSHQYWRRIWRPEKKDHIWNHYLFQIFIYNWKFEIMTEIQTGKKELGEICYDLKKNIFMSQWRSVFERYLFVFYLNLTYFKDLYMIENSNNWRKFKQIKGSGSNAFKTNILVFHVREHSHMTSDF